MGERIYVMNETDGQQRLEPLMEELFDLEDTLQALLAKHPELIDGEQIRPGDPRRWILVRREQGIAATPGGGDWWSVDLLLIDQDATPTLVEVKRGSNPEIRRTVVGQMLEYAAHARHSWTADDIRRHFEETQTNQGRDANDTLREFLGLEGDDEDEELDDGALGDRADGFWDRVATNLAANRLRLLFVADEIPAPLAQVVEFLNEQMPNIEVMAVEIKQFNGSSIQTLVPRVIGRTAPSRAEVRCWRPTAKTNPVEYSRSRSPRNEAREATETPTLPSPDKHGCQHRLSGESGNLAFELKLRLDQQWPVSCRLVLSAYHEAGVAGLGLHTNFCVWGVQPSWRDYDTRHQQNCAASSPRNG